MNEAYARSCGYTPEQMIGKNHFALYPHAENEAIFACARDTGEPAEFHDKPFVFRDQPERGVTYWDWTLNPVKNAAGKVVGLVFSLFETTARKRAEEAVRQERDFSAAVLETAGALVLVLDTSGRIKRFNRACAALTGYPEEEVLGRPVWSLIPPEDVDGVRQEWSRLNSGTLKSRHENHWLARDGTRRLIAWSNAVLVGANGEVQHVIATGLDTTEQRRAEEAVREKAEELRAVLDTAPAAVWIAQDRHCRVITGNAYADELIMGTDRGGNISRSAAPSEAAVTYQVFRDGVELGPEELPAQRATATGKPVPAFEMELVFPNGRRLNLLAGAVPLFDGEGKVRGAIVAGLDVTALRKAQKELERVEERARFALQAGRMGTWDRLLPDGPTVWNEDHYRILGYDPAQTTASNEAWEARVHPEDLRAFYERIAEVLKRGGDFDQELRIVWPGGEVRWVELRGAIQCDANGQARRSCGVVFDFTERKRAEEALRLSQEQLNQAVAVAGVGTFQHDHVSGGVEYSPVLRELMGFNPEERVTLAAIIDKVVPEDREAMVEALRRAHDPAGEGRFAVDHRVRNAGGRVRWISVRSQTFFEGEGSGRRLVRTIGAGLDVTERKEAQAELEQLVAERTAELEQLVGELEHFSYTITHDLKAPLRAMRGFAEVIQEIGVATEAKPFLHKISAAAERMDHLIADALDYSRSVRQELPLADVDAGALLRGMLDTYPELQPDKARIVVEGRLPVVLANEAGLTQCFSNLLGNAVKFVKKGEKPEIRVWAEEAKSEIRKRKAESGETTPSSGWVRIWVEDKGIGISKEMLPRVFGLFARGSKDYEGTGIGLALVRKVAQRMGGKVGVESEEGKGSRFWIELKCGEAKLAFSGPTARQGTREGSGTVLYVEDEESDAMFMQRAFKGKGLAGKLQLVGDGRAAIEYLSGAGKYGDRGKYPVPALVLLDLNLPQVGGFEVLRWMRNNPDYARLPVVIFSSSTREDDRVTAKELGANDFVAKPSSGRKFAEVAEELQRRWLGQVGSAA
ncbi:MAG: PAS domain S-box protein [Verrucomicrobiia bacterium]